MKERNKINLRISYIVGLTAAIGGWSIFLTWTIARYFFAVDLDYLEIVGFFWMVGFFWLSILSITLLISYIFSNRKKLHIKMLTTTLLLLSNIPSVWIITSLHYDIERKVFIKLNNESKMENPEFILVGKREEWQIGLISRKDDKVFSYDPHYINNDARSYQLPDSLKLIIKHAGSTDTLDFPTISLGECKHLTLSEDLELLPK